MERINRNRMLNRYAMEGAVLFTGSSLMAYYPSNMDVIKKNQPELNFFLLRSLENIELANREVKRLAEQFGYHFINVNEGLSDSCGNLKAEFTTDGVHMTPDAYAIVMHNLKKYI